MTIKSNKVLWCPDREVYSLQEWTGEEWVEMGHAKHEDMSRWAHAVGLGPQWEMTWPGYRAPGEGVA